MALEDILVHTATPEGTAGDAEWVDGEQDLLVVEGEPFPCVLFLPMGSESDRRGRQVTKPQILYLSVYDDGRPIAVANSDRLSITAPELGPAVGKPVGEPFLFQVDGNPQPLGKPGEDLVGMYVYLKAVSD